MPAWWWGFSSEVAQRQVPILISLTWMALVCLVNMLHLSEECWLLTGQVQKHFLSSAVLSPSSHLPRFSICCPCSSGYSKCEGVNVWEKSSMCLPPHVWCYCTKTTGMLSELLPVMEPDTLFLFIPPPAVTVVSGVCLLNSGPWDTWRTVKSTNPPNYAECYSSEHTLDSCYLETKAVADI